MLLLLVTPILEKEIGQTKIWCYVFGLFSVASVKIKQNCRRLITDFQQ